MRPVCDLYGEAARAAYADRSLSLPLLGDVELTFTRESVGTRSLADPAMLIPIMGDFHVLSIQAMDSNVSIMVF
jgi:hypothetical protein